jgi:hypothetical protein
MAGAKVIGGQEALFWVVPIAAGFLVLATYGLGCRLASPTAGLIGAWLVATSPAVLLFAVQPMSDVPAAAAWAVAFYFLFGATWRCAAMAGVTAAIAIVIRPNLVFGAPIMAAWYLPAMWGSDAVARRRTLEDGIVFCLSALPGILFIAVFNTVMNGSPLRSGYGQIDAYFGLTHFWPNAWSYLSWLVETQTPFVLLGVAALLAPGTRMWSGARDRWAVVVAAAFSLAVWVFYCFYMRFDVWWALRLMLPIWPFLLLGVGAVVVTATRLTSPVRQIGTAALLVFVGAHTMHFSAEHGSFRLWKADRRHPSVGRLVRETTEPNSVILSVLHSGSVRYYGGRVTMRYDWVDPQWFDRTVEWLTARDVHSYLLVEEEELEAVRARFLGHTYVAAVGRRAGVPAFGTGSRDGGTLRSLGCAGGRGGAASDRPLDGHDQEPDANHDGRPAVRVTGAMCLGTCVSWTVRADNTFSCSEPCRMPPVLRSSQTCTRCSAIDARPIPRRSNTTATANRGTPLGCRTSSCFRRTPRRSAGSFGWRTSIERPSYRSVSARRSRGTSTPFTAAFRSI